MAYFISSGKRLYRVRLRGKAPDIVAVVQKRWLFNLVWVTVWISDILPVTDTALLCSNIKWCKKAVADFESLEASVF